MTDYSTAVNPILAEASAFVTHLPAASRRETSLPRLHVWSSISTTVPSSALFNPMFYVVLQGTKVMRLGNNYFPLTAGECVATSFGLPFVVHFENATREAPYIAMALDLDVDLLVEVMLDMPKTEERWVCSAAAGELSGALAESFTRLVRLISQPDDVAMLRRSYERELYYRLLQSSMGDTLRQLGQRDSRLRRIKQAADWLCANPHKPLIIPELATSIGMSVTSFHRHFKAVTGHSPLVFQRQIRLLDARRLLQAGATTVSQVADVVGYVSPSQFSREYKSMFGVPPAIDLGRVSETQLALQSTSQV